MFLESTCVDSTAAQCQRYMKGARKASYKLLVKKIKKELPELHEELALKFYNPWEDDTRQTKTHYILVHSAIEYFINKN